jgi:putative heme-binding domain-containing protein
LLPSDENGRRVARKALHARPEPRLLEAIVSRLSAEGAGDASYAALAEALPPANPEQSVMLASALARTDTGADQLVALAESGKISPRLLVRSSVANALEHRAAAIRNRVSALTAALPSESVRLEQVIAERVANYRPARTDPLNGAKVFALNCAACHHFRDTGGNIGPSLDGIGVRGPARLFEDILDPSRNIDPAFQRTTLTLKSGAEIVGCNIQSSPDTVTINEIGGKVLTFSPGQIAKTRTDAVSIMPAVFEQSIAPDDLSDVIAYLIGKS